LALTNLLTPYYFVPLILILPLALIMRLGRLTVIAGILAVIGLAAYGPRYLPRAQAADAPTLSLVTWNVYRRNLMVEEVIQWLHHQDADVVLLQELPRLEMEHILAGTETYYPYAYVREPSDGGMVILSRIPILEATSFALSNANRIQQRIVLVVQGQPVVICNVHLANPIPAHQIPEYRREAPFLLHLIASYDDDQRDVEVEMLLNHIANEQHPLIVAGDFNMSDQSGLYPIVTAHLRDSFAEAGFGLGGTWPATDTRGLPPIVPPLLRIDYIWHSADWTSLNAATAPAPGSDHFSVSATLALSP
jgi:endonuclease/exonuclease/phosphatase (EEP) superfamily protein YafD